jgi:predicted hotdog family 3-hydroxylacyl-ACP dehydratase
MPFVIRFDDTKRNSMWLRSEHPAVKWGPLADARRYRTKAAAVSAATKLRLKKQVVVQEEAELRAVEG